MTGSVISVSEDTDVTASGTCWVERRIRRVPVISGQRLAGIVTLSIDHRADGGATGAGFLTRLKKLIEEPLGIVL